MITVTLPDGRRVDVQTDDPKRAAALAHKWAKANPKGNKKASGWGAQFLEGVLPGASQALGGVIQVIDDATPSWLKYGKDRDLPAPTRTIQEAYNAGHKQTKADNAAYALAHPKGAAAAQVGGFGAGMVLPTSKVAQGAGLFVKAKAGAKAGAAYGGASGLTSSESEDLLGKAIDAESTGILGGLTGAAAPYVLRGVGAAAAPFRPLLQPVASKTGETLEALSRITPPWLGKRVLAREGAQLARDPVAAAANRELDKTIRTSTNPVTGAPMRPHDLPAEVQRRHDLGVPAVAADLDEPLRGRFAKAARSPGPAVATVRRHIDARQAANVERAGRHLSGSLGPVADVQGQAEALNQAARTAAAPLYAASDAHPVPVTAELQELFSRPTARKAIETATRSLQDQGIEPAMDGLIQAADGSWGPGRVPVMAVYDHAKTHLDDAVFGGQSPFATPELQREGRGAASIRARLLDLMDGGGLEVPPTSGTPGVPGVLREGLNPYWKPAREAYAGPVQSRKALELGEEMAGAGAEDIAARLDGMSPDQAEFYRLGHRSGLAGDLKGLPDHADAAKRLAGSAEKREALAAAHGPEAAGALQERLGAEQDATRTWEAVRGVSGGQAPDVARQEQELASAGNGILQTLAGHPGPGLLNIASAVAQGRRGGDAVEARVASVLGEQEPDKLTEAISDMLRERARNRLVERNATKATQGASRWLGSILGTNMTEPLEEQPDY